MNPARPILLVDDDRSVLLSEKLALSIKGIDNVIPCGDSRDALSLIERHGCGIAIVDLVMPHMDGMALQEAIAEKFPEVVVILLTGMDKAETAVACMKRGAFDYLLKPVDASRLAACATRAITEMEARLERERIRASLFKRDLERPDAFTDIITASPRISLIFKYIEAVAPTPLPILICGETGVGKELFARATHKASGRSGGFVPVNCAGIDDTYFSDTLFGHAARAFTGVDKARDGLISKAAGGTLFLDEIGDLHPESQIKLLRLLQEGSYYKLGSDTSELSTARIVAATNVDLAAAQKQGRFRKDLYYRLHSHRIDIPALRERAEDIPALLVHFLEAAAEKLGKAVPTVPQELPAYVASYHFPGNVRELEGMVYDAVARHQGGVMSCECFRTAIGKAKSGSAPEATRLPEAILFPDPLPALPDVEKALAVEALRRAGGNKSLAALLMGVTRKTFRAKLPTPTSGEVGKDE